MTGDTLRLSAFLARACRIVAALKGERRASEAVRDRSATGLATQRQCVARFLADQKKAWLKRRARPAHVHARPRASVALARARRSAAG